MSIKGLRKMALLLTFWVAAQMHALRALAISGNTVTGNLIVTGSNVYMGEQTSTTIPGWGTLYVDSTNSTVYFQGTRGGNTWEWQQNDGIVQMKLDNNNNLTLYNQASPQAAGVTLSPLSTGTSTFASSVIINGINNEMPNQVLVNSNSVLTEGLADSRYGITIGGGLGLNGGTDTGYGATAMGRSATASGQDSVAIGAATSANNNRSVALGFAAVANGDSSVAMGYGTVASGNYSTASGYYTDAQAYESFVIGIANSGLNADGVTTASATSWVPTDPIFEIGNGTASSNYINQGCSLSNANGAYNVSPSDAFVVYKNGSVAMGKNSSASGYYGVAMGNGAKASGFAATAMGSTTASAAYATALGAYNVGLNVSGTNSSSTTWVATDPLFEVGNGTSTNPSDALVVYKNGNAVVQGNVTAGGAISTTNSISAGSLSTTGAVTATSVTTSSTLTAGGTVTAPSVVLTTQTGDIPMFTGY